MFLEQELMSGIRKFGYSNIEPEKARGRVEILIKRYSKSKDKKDLEIKAVFEKTLFVENINSIIRQDGGKILSCEECRAFTQTLVKLTKRSKKVCPNCLIKELKEEKPEKDNPNLKDDKIDAKKEKGKEIKQ